MYWEARKWLSGGGKLLRDDGFKELLEINYKENNSSKLQMESKEELSKRRIESPDNADAFALTFIDTTDILDEDDMEML